MSTQQFWDSRYGGPGHYMNTRAFAEPVGDKRYDEMKIYNKWPPWKVGMIITGIIVLISGIVLWAIDMEVWAVFVAALSCCVLYCFYQKKCGDIPGQRKDKMNRRRKVDNRGDCGGGCGAACGGHDAGDGGCGGADGGGDGGGCGGDGGCGGGCGGD